jgi:hypothetical protein
MSEVIDALADRVATLVIEPLPERAKGVAL